MSSSILGKRSELAADSNEVNQLNQINDSNEIEFEMPKRRRILIEEIESNNDEEIDTDEIEQPKHRKRLRKGSPETTSIVNPILVEDSEEDSDLEDSEEDSEEDSDLEDSDLEDSDLDSDLEDSDLELSFNKLNRQKKKTRELLELLNEKLLGTIYGKQGSATVKNWKIGKAGWLTAIFSSGATLRDCAIRWGCNPTNYKSEMYFTNRSGMRLYLDDIIIDTCWTPRKVNAIDLAKTKKKLTTVNVLISQAKNEVEWTTINVNAVGKRILKLLPEQHKIIMKVIFRYDKKSQV